MKFLIDENLPPRLVAWLNERGHEAVHVQDVSLAGQSDKQLEAFASAAQRIIVTKDSDFDAAAVRVLKLSIGNTSTPDLLAWLEGSWPDVLTRFGNGETFVQI